MTNREWLNTLDDYHLATFIILHLRKIGVSYKNILVLERWLNEEYVAADMPQTKGQLHKAHRSHEKPLK